MDKDHIIESTEDYTAYGSVKMGERIGIDISVRYKTGYNKNLGFVLINNQTELSLESFQDSSDKNAYDTYDIWLPARIGDYVVSQIGGKAFNGCESLEKIVLPKTINKIADDCFTGCINLRYIIVDSENITYDSRDNCNALIETKNNVLVVGCQNTIIPESVSEIGARAFRNCPLSKINIPDSVKKIGNHAFSDCDLLTSLTIPESVTEIGDGAFQNCKNMKTVNIPKTVTKIGQAAFKNCQSLEKIDIPENIRTINASTFDFCNNLAEIVLPSSLKEIGECAFRCCDNLTSIYIPNTVTKIGKSAFFACYKLPIIKIPDLVTEISDSTFYNCSGLTQITIPSSIKSIGATAFVYCNQLTRIIIPQNVVSIGENAFWGCYGLKEISVDTKNSNYDSRNGCNALIETATNKLLRGCDNSIIPDSVKIISRGAFSWCKGIETIFIPKSVIRIEDEAFCECSGLKDLVIPSSVKNIGSNVFDHCANLQKIIISNISLLKESGLSDNVTIEYSYEDLEEYLKNNSFDESNNAEHVKLVSKIPFTKIINSFADKLYETNPKYYNKALLSSIIDNISYLMHINFGFVKYIHIYNHIGENQVGNINLYVDFTQEKITDTRNEVRSNNIVFDDYSLIYLLQNNYMALMGGIIVECCKSSNYGVLDTKYYPVINTNPDDDNDKFSTYLKEFFKIKDDELLSKDLDSLFEFSNSDENILTNYYFLGNYGEKLDRDYSLWANIGVDGTNVSNKECIKAFLETFRQFLNATSTNLQFGGVKTNELRQKAVESAISQSDLRNTAHNLGAHVLSRFDANKYDHEDINTFVRTYLNFRINYLGEKTFGATQMLTTKMLYGDILKDFVDQKILLDNISGVADFKPKFKFLYNGKTLDYKNDIPVAMPADIYGSMALYNIVENIIRNSAKHSNNSNTHSTFTIDFTDTTENNLSDYYCVEIDNGIKENNIDSLVKKINGYINDSILNDVFKLRDKNLGIIEMSASAAFLRKIDATCIDSYDYRFSNNDVNFNDENNLIVFKAINKNEALGYRFFVLKAKDFLFVGNWNKVKAKNELINIGIQFVDENKFINDMSNGVSYPHQFLICSDNVSDEIKRLLSNDNDCKTLLPLRKLIVTSDEASKLVKILNDKNDIDKLLRDFTWTHCCNNNDNLYIGATINEDELDSCDQIVFLNHAFELFHQETVDAKKENHELWVENLSSYTERKLPHYAELSVTGYGKTPLQRYLNKITNDKQIKCELFEAYRSKVVVIDERIQEYSITGKEGSSKDESGPVPCSALFQSTNIIIPDVSLAPRVFDNKTIDNIETFVKNHLDNAFILVHFGILERMYKGDEKIITQKLTDWSEKATRVIVTSGRGSHSLNLPNSVCYANLSSVLYAFKENRNKYLINYLLNQSRRKDV